MTDPLTFRRSFTQQEPLPDAAIAAAEAVLRSGRLHRYNLAPDEVGETAQLEREYADWQGAQYCLALTSCGQALQIALRAAGVVAGDHVLTNSFTLAPVPGAIQAVGGLPVLVEIDQNMRLDLDDLVTKIEHTHARYLLISHMRGHLCDMARVTEICTRAGVVLIEDCAHTMGAYWRETRSGNFGLAGCFSTQTYKHMNSGEGGFLTSNDPDFMARATILSGSYMLYPRHGAGPDATHFEGPKYLMPNTSARMDHLRAAILRPQLQNLDENIRRWNARYRAVAQELARHSAIALPKRPVEEKMVGSSIQFRVPSASEKECQAFIATALARGVEVKWFGRPTPDGFTSNHHSWRYAPAQKMPQSDAILATLFDIRLPLTFSEEECGLIGQILYLAANETLGQPRDRPDTPKDMAS